MDQLALVFGVLCLCSAYAYAAVWLRLNDSILDLPRWVPLAWPVLLPFVVVRIAFARIFREVV